MIWKLSFQEVTYPVVTPEVAFTGDTSGAVFSAPGFEDALAAKLLIIEATFLSEDVTLEHAKVCFWDTLKLTTPQGSLPDKSLVKMTNLLNEDLSHEHAKILSTARNRSFSSTSCAYWA